MSKVDRSKVVVIDETAVRQIEEGKRRRGWGPVGVEVERHVIFGSSSQNLSVLGLMKHTGMLLLAAKEKGTVDTRFIVKVFKEKVLPMIAESNQKFLFVLDNAKTHRAAIPFLNNMLRPLGCAIVFVPPYSPEFQPIELVWAAMKHSLKEASGFSINPWGTVRNVIGAIPAQQYTSCFRHCGYTHGPHP